jgi:hypothetical protein
MALTRRKFLLMTGATVSVAAAATGAYVARPYMSRRAHPKLDMSYPTGVLQDDEMRTIIALAEVLVPAEFTPPEDFFRGYVDWVTRGQPGYLKEYRGAARMLDATARSHGKSALFRELAVPERDELLRTLLWQYDADDRIVRKLEKVTASRDASALRQCIMNPMIQYYYRSPYGWAVVGYKHFPGVPPTDPRAYTRPLDKEEAAA